MGERAGDDRPDSMQDIAAGQVKGRGDLRPAGFLFMPLPPHQFRTGQAELNPGKGVDGIVNAPVTGDKAAQHLAVCRIDDRVAAQGCDIPLPEIDPFPHRLQIGKIRNPPAPDFFLQVGVL